MVKRNQRRPNIANLREKINEKSISLQFVQELKEHLSEQERKRESVKSIIRSVPGVIDELHTLLSTSRNPRGVIVFKNKFILETASFLSVFLIRCGETKSVRLRLSSPRHQSCHRLFCVANELVHVTPTNLLLLFLTPIDDFESDLLINI